MNTKPQAPTKTLNTWLLFALGTVACWGVYGIYLHEGQMAMGDAVNGRYKAFLLVGVAYFVVAILGPALILMKSGGSLKFWEYPTAGLKLSFLAGTVGAIGAFFVLLAFGVKGSSPPVVMSIIFAGAPIVNAIVHLLKHPPHGGWLAISPLFYLGIALAAVGGCLVTFFKPGPPPKKPGIEQVQTMNMSEYEVVRHD